MVMIQVLIGEVRLDDADEFGVELGLQDSVLFDRSLLGAPIFQNTTTTLGNQQTTQTQSVLAATNTPGTMRNRRSPLQSRITVRYTAQTPSGIAATGPLINAASPVAPHPAIQARPDDSA